MRKFAVLLGLIGALCFDDVILFAQTSASAPYAYALPIEKGGCGGFSVDRGKMYLFEYKGRTLHEVSPSGRLTPRENVSGWYVVDVAVIDGQAIYCSRDRVFRRVRGKIDVNKIPDAKKLISITADDDEVFLLDAPPESTIIVLDRKTGRETRRLDYDGRNPIDVVEGDGQLWVLDKGDRCIHAVDKQTGKTTLRIQAGPGVQGYTHGLLYRDGHLYVHEADFSRLRRVEWKQEGPAVWSWSQPLNMTFVQESWNEHNRDTTRVTFKVPVPPTRDTQEIGDLSWSQRPTRVYKDRFGQTIAEFVNLKIPPGGKHVLTYTADVTLKAVQYEPPPLPLASLKKIDPAVRRTYLASNTMFRMEDPLVRAAAREARKGPLGTEPENVRELIENISNYITGRVTYKLDDSWKDAVTVLKGNSGSCSEYSFLFSALCRLNDVPTRLVGGVQIGDYGAEHETKGFHRWTEVYYPELGWIPVDVTKIDGAEGSMDYEFLFGTPGYFVVVSQGGIDENVMGTTYLIWRSYRGGKRKRNNVVRIEPALGSESFPVVKVRR